MIQALQNYSELIPFILTLVSLSMVAMEWLLLTLSKRVHRHKEGWVNVGSAALNFIPLFILNPLIFIGFMFGVYQWRLFDLGMQLPVWLLCYLAYDFMSYLVHLMSHKVRFFWAIHSVHHSPKEMKASVSFRGSFADFLLSPHLIIWLPLLGFHPFMIIIVEGIALLYGVPLHFHPSMVPFKGKSWLRKFLITPSAHRLHHAKNDLYLDTNYGLTFSIWDRIFKTYQTEDPHIEPVYGLTRDIQSDHLWIAQTDEWRQLWTDLKSTRGIVNKVKMLGMPPGWMPKGQGKTARQIRREALRSLASNQNEGKLPG